MKNKHLPYFALALFLFQSCDNSSNDSTKAAKESNDRKDSTELDSNTKLANMTKMSAGPVDKDAASFTVDAASGGMAEVALGKFAMEHGKSGRVKAFGSMMVTDHTKVNNELKALAIRKNITLPNVPSNNAQRHMEKLMSKRGNDFDKSYMSMMLDDHKADVADFLKTSKECKDPDIKNFAIKTLPVLLVHLDSAKAITGKN